MKNIIAAVLIALAIAGVGFYGVSTFAQIKTREVNNAARYQCAQSSRYTTEDESGATVSYPVEELYVKCLEEMGIN